MIAQNWLPLDALTSDKVTTALAKRVDAWSMRWLESGRISLANVRVLEGVGGGFLGRSEWERVDQCQARFLPLGSARLLTIALDYDVARASRTDMDRKLLQDLRHRILLDLEKSLLSDGAPFPLPSGLAESLAQRGNIGLDLASEDGDALLTLAAPSFLLAALVHATLPLRQTGAAPIASLSHALSPCAMSFDVYAGRARITLAELGGLARGDVLVLDRAVEDGVILSAGDSAERSMTGDLCNDEGHVAIRLHTPRRVS